MSTEAPNTVTISSAPSGSWDIASQFVQAMSPRLRFGKKAPKHDYRTLNLENYIDRSVLPAPPPTWRIKTTPQQWPMYGNDQYGDCTLAAYGHMTQAWRGDVGNPYTPDAMTLLKAYWTIGNLEHPQQPNTDQGLYCLDVLKYAANTGIAGEKIGPFVKVLPQDLQLAAWLFDGLYIGFQCQQNVISDFNAGRPWTPGTLAQSGHCVPIIQYDGTYVDVVTWAREQKGTYPWVQQCVDEMWAIIPLEFLQGAPSGFDAEHLWADLQAVKTPDSPSPAPLPTPPSPTPPTPTPVPGPTVAIPAGATKITFS